MTRVVWTLGVMAGVATPAAAQWLGEPMWNSPTGGGFVVNADYGKPNDNYGGGSAWGVRLSVGAGTTTVTLGAANWNPPAGESLTSVGGNLAFPLIGGSRRPTASPAIRANLQVGVAHSEVANLILSPASETVVTGALGLGVRLPARGYTVEPYVSPGVRYRTVSSGGTATELGWAIGANVGFGLFGMHIAYDSENVKGGGSVGVFGIGAQVTP